MRLLRPTTPREPKPSRFGLFRFRSPLLTESLICFLFLRVLRWFTSPGSLNLPCEGLPHSEIPGSKPVCGSPRLIAACHVLHRFSAPRHSPSTLSSLTIKYLRRESFLSIYPTLLSKTMITADQKVPRIPGHRFIRAADSNHRSSRPPSSRLRRASCIARLRRATQDGGAERNRTADSSSREPGFLLAGGVAPEPPDRSAVDAGLVVELSGIEPPTYGLQSRRSPS